MNDDFEIVGDAAREARVVAVVLGEASDFEREEVIRLCEENPELQVFRRRMEAVHGLIGETKTRQLASRTSSWKLSQSRRDEVLAKLGEKETVVAGPKRKVRFLGLNPWQHAALITVACLVVGLWASTRLKNGAPVLSLVEQSPAGGDQELASMANEELDSISRQVRQSRAIQQRGSADSELAQTVTVAGQVNKPGPQDYKSGMTLEDALGEAGGVGTFGTSRRVNVYREGKKYALDMTNEKHRKERIYPNDTVEVDQVKAWESGSDSGVGGDSPPKAVAALRDPSATKPTVPSSAMSRVIASNTASPTAIPVPEMSSPVAAVEFGDGDNYGRGWGWKEDERAVAMAESAAPELDATLLPPIDPKPQLRGSSLDAFAEVDEPMAEAESPEIGDVVSARQELDDLEANHPNNFDHFSAPSEDAIAAYDARVEQARARVAQESGNRREVSFGVDAEITDFAQNKTKELDFGWSEESENGVPQLSAPPQNFSFLSDVNEGGAASPVPKNRGIDEVIGEASSDYRFRLGKEMKSGGEAFLSGGFAGEGNITSRFSNSSELGESTFEGLDDQTPQQQAAELLEDGREAYFNKDYEEPTRLYGESLNRLPLGLEMEGKRQEIEAHLGDSSVASAAQYDRTGKYDDQSRLGGGATLEEQIAAKEQSIAAVQNQRGLVELATEMHDYKEATRMYENSLALLQELKLKHSAERVELRSPQEPVTIQRDPRIPKKKSGFLGLGKYESKADVQVQTAGDLGAAESRQYFETQEKAATATKTLSSVVESLDLDKKWGSSKEEAVKKLKSSVKVSQRPGTDILEIKGLSKDPELAREIAAEVAVAYQNRRNGEESQRAEAQLGALDAEIKNQKDKVDAQRRVLDTVVRITGRPYFEGTVNSSQNTESLLKMTAEQNAFEMKKNLDQYKIYLNKLETLKPDQVLRYAAELPVDNNAVHNLHTEYLTASRELGDFKAKGLGERHPSMQVAEARIKGLRTDMKSAVIALKESLETNRDLIAEQLLVMEATRSEPSPKEKAEKIRKEKAELEALKKKLREKKAQEAAKSVKAMGEMDAAAKSDSTFSLNVSDVSFKLAKAALEQGKWPETVRVEEFVNAFSYGERVLAPNERVGVAMEQAAHPFLSQRNLLRLSLQTAATGRGAGVPLRLTVVLDKSGSMERLDRAAAVDEAFRVLVDQLNPGDRVTLVGFSRTPTLLADFVDGAEGERLLKILRETPSEGGTNVEEALKLARAKALEHFQEGAQNRVILLTDGIANLGEEVPEQLMTLVEGMRENEVAFDACGVGVEGLNDDILEALTRKGDGRYYLLGSTEDSGADFAKQVAGALRPAAQNVKVQIEWNAGRVGKWRLYGFEKHELKKEDFRNDAVDAAEMAAEEEGVALYHVEVKSDGEGPLGVARVRFLDVANNEMVEREWEISYEGEAPTLSKADQKIRLAGVAGLVAEKLARSAVGERAEWDELLEMTRQLKTVFPKEKRVKDLERMIEQAKGLE